MGGGQPGAALDLQPVQPRRHPQEAVDRHIDAAAVLIVDGHAAADAHDVARPQGEGPGPVDGAARSAGPRAGAAVPGIARLAEEAGG